MSLWLKIATTVLLFVAGALGDGAIKDQFGYGHNHGLTIVAAFCILWLWLLHPHAETLSIAKRAGPNLTALLILFLSGAVVAWWSTEPSRTLLCQGSDGAFNLAIGTAWLKAQKSIKLGDGTQSIAFDYVQARPAVYRAWKEMPSGAGTVLELDRMTGRMQIWQSTSECVAQFSPEACMAAAVRLPRSYECQPVAAKF